MRGLRIGRKQEGNASNRGGKERRGKKNKGISGQK